MIDLSRPMEIFRRQTVLAATCMAGHLQPGDSAIDGTAGTGADTLLMAQAVGRAGKIYAFDIQENAKMMTAKKLSNAGLSDCLHFYLQSHDEMSKIPEITMDSKIRGAMFNLGYLPGGNQTVVTVTEKTLSAVRQALNLMTADSLMTICAYRHSAGEKEQHAVDQFCAGLGKGIDVHKIETLNHAKSPVLYLVHKRGS